MSWVVFDAEDYWSHTPTPIDEERQLWWCFAHANSELIEEMLSHWNKPPAHFCDQQRNNSPLHNMAWHVEKLSAHLRETVVSQLVGIGIDLDALNAQGQTAMHMIGARMGLLNQRSPHHVGPNLAFVAQLLQQGAHCALNDNGEHPLVEFLSHCHSKNEVRHILDLFANNGADLSVFFNDPCQLDHPRIAQWSTYLTRRATGEQKRRLAAEVETIAAPQTKRKM